MYPYRHPDVRNHLHQTMDPVRVGNRDTDTFQYGLQELPHRLLQMVRRIVQKPLFTSRIPFSGKESVCVVPRRGAASGRLSQLILHEGTIGEREGAEFVIGHRLEIAVDHAADAVVGDEEDAACRA